MLHRRNFAAREECAAAAARYMLYDAALKREVAAWAPERRRTKRMPDSDFSTRALLKWQLVGLLEYSYVFYTDIDTDLFFDTAGAPPPAARATGASSSARGRRGSTHSRRAATS